MAVGWPRGDRRAGAGVVGRWRYGRAPQRAGYSREVGRPRQSGGERSDCRTEAAGRPRYVGGPT